jgi:hypothetical protein
MPSEGVEYVWEGAGGQLLEMVCVGLDMLKDVRGLE